MNTNPTFVVAVGMSGGVDSSVAAALLKAQGHQVLGLFMKNWEEVDERGVCRASEDFADVEDVCQRLDIPYYTVEFVKEYRERVFDKMVTAYGSGVTPNPDVLCNREIKFHLFFKKAMALGADYLATGHYCQNLHIGPGGGRALVKGVDFEKDQSYFLYTMKKELLERILFPLGGLLKTQVRKMAAHFALPNKDKKDSTGLCFIGERNFRPFLSRYLPLRPGPLKKLNGEVVGVHQGAAYYTVGQRKGLGLGGLGRPWFVVGKDVAQNVVWAERGEDHPALYSRRLWAHSLSWVDEGFSPTLPFSCQAKIRYRSPDQECTIEAMGSSSMEVVFKKPQRAVAPGQSIVFYRGRECLGGAVIERSSPETRQD